MYINKKIKRPYFVCGGYKHEDAWIFFTPFGEVKIEKCNDFLEVIFPLCNGYNQLSFIENQLLDKGFLREDIEEVINVLCEYLILVDSCRIFYLFYAYSKNPLIFFEELSAAESLAMTKNSAFHSNKSEDLFSANLSAQKTNLQEILDRRKSTRKFSDKYISSNIIVSLFWCAYGKQSKRKNDPELFLDKTFTVPSGGALYPLLIYLVLFKDCDNLKKGIYLWHKEEGAFEIIKKGDYLEISSNLVSGIPSLENATGLICVVADFERTAKKYGNKAYNLIQQEVGHAMQNFTLFCAENNIGSVEIGGYEDEGIAEMLDVDFPEFAPLIISAFGSL